MRAHQCCCGCSLETGSFLISWIILICNLLIIRRHMYSLEKHTDLGIYTFAILSYILGVVFGGLGIYAVLKDRMRLLLCVYYYILFEFGLFLMVVIICLFDSHAYNVQLLVYIVLDGFLGYFAVVVKSYYDAMIANRIQSILPVTEEPVMPILLRFARFPAQQQCTEFPNEPPSPPNSVELPTEPKIND